MHTNPSRLAHSGMAWFAVSVAASLVGQWLFVRAFAASSTGIPTLVFAGVAATACAGLAAWMLADDERYDWLLPLAAVNILWLQPGRAGDAANWRLEWGMMGLGWTLLAVVIFARLLARSDELHRRLHLEGAFLGLALALITAVAYALFETRLPVLRAQWVAVGLLLSWWGGVLVSARRYRWRT